MTGRSVSLLAACFVVTGLSACGGAGSSRFYFGGVVVAADAAGAVQGVDASDLTVVRRGGNGFTYGFADQISATGLSNIQIGTATPGDTGSFAVAGLLPGADVGAPITQGSAFLAGEIALVKVTGTARSPDSAQWVVEDYSDGFTATVALQEDPIDPNFPDPFRQRELYISGASDDGRISIPRTVLTDLTTGQDGTNTTGNDPLTVVVDGVTVSTSSELAVGRRALIGAFAGEADDLMVAGGIALGG